jgi:acyl-CoA synthetase (AMP-forming)/AMP-acid ligase II
MTGYWKNPQATGEALKDGWIYTRDIGRMDEEGYIFLVDRKSEMIISGGLNVYPQEVEQVLYKHPAVLEAAVFGVPDEKWGETIKAAVVLKAGTRATAGELIEFCKARLASYKKPTSVDIVAELPKSDTGKILRRAVREPYWRGHERKIH